MAARFKLTAKISFCTLIVEKIKLRAVVKTSNNRKKVTNSGYSLIKNG